MYLIVVPACLYDNRTDAILAPDFERRFGGLRRLYGNQAQAIWQAHIVVIGLGGVGSWSAEALARSGVKKLTLIDLDHVSESNINRQIQAVDLSLGMSKVQALCDRIHSFHPECQVQCIEAFVDADNWLELMPPQSMDAVLDACDQVQTKAYLCNWAKRFFDGVFVSVGAAGGKRLLQAVECMDLAHVSHDPVLGKVRYLLRKNYGFPKNNKSKMGVHCVFSREPVLAPWGHASGHVQSGLECHGYGSSVTATASFGFLAANYLLNQLTRMPAP